MSSVSGSSDTLPVSNRGKKRRKKRNKSQLPDSDAEETSKLRENVCNASKTASENEEDSHESMQSSSSSSSSSSSDSESDSESIVSLPPPLDGGWGWVVVIGSFFAHFLCDGLAYNAGVIYEKLHETFHTGASETAWVSSVFLAVPYLLGPVAGAFTNRYGCRIATIAGAIIGTLGCVLSFFVDSLGMLCITFGVIFGLGQALVLFASSVIVPYYFEERRSLAYGLAVSGSGIGTAVLAPLLNWLMDEYGWQGMMLILGGLSLNLVVCGALYRPLATREYKRKFRSKRNLEQFEKMSRMSRESNGMGTPPCSSQIIESHENGLCGGELSSQILIKHPSDQLEVIAEDLTLAVDVPTLGSSPPAFTRSCDVVTFENYNFDDFVAQTEITTVETSYVPVKKIPAKQRRRRSKNPREVRLIPVARRQPHTIAPLSKVDIFYRGSVINPHQRPNRAFNDPNVQPQQRRVRALSCPHLAPREPVKQTLRDAASDFFDELGTTIKRMASISILRRPLFIWFWLSNFLFYMWFEVPLNYIPEYTTKLTGSEHSYTLVIIIGLVTTVGQIVFGYLCDKPWVSSLLLYGVGVAITGASTLFIPLINNFFGLTIYTAIFTFGSCGNTALDTIILTELLGIGRLTNSYGLLMVGQGLASLFGAPLAGYIIDMYDSGDLKGYVICFMHTGAWLMVSGVMIAVITPCVKRLRRWKPCIPEEEDPEESEEDETTKHSLSNRDLEAGSSLSPSPDYRKYVSTNRNVATTGISTRLGILRVNKIKTPNSAGGSGLLSVEQSRNPSPFDGQSESRCRSLSTSELNVFPPAGTISNLQPHGSVALNQESETNSNQLNSSELTDVASQNTTTALSESVSSSATTQTNLSPPTYAETAVGYAENPEGWADQLYKDRSLSVI